MHSFPKLSTSYFYNVLNTWNFPYYRKKKKKSIFSNYSSGSFKFGTKLTEIRKGLLTSQSGPKSENSGRISDGKKVSVTRHLCKGSQISC